MIHRLRRTCLLLIACRPPVLRLGENWPCFRGPTRQGISTDRNCPGTGMRSRGSSGKSKYLAPAGPPRSSGKTAWCSPRPPTVARHSTSWPWSGTPAACRGIGKCYHRPCCERKNGNSYASSTPATDGELVLLPPVRMEVWSPWISRDRSAGPIPALPVLQPHGLATSPVLWEDLLITARDGSSDQGDEKIGWQIPWDKSFVMALDKHTGQLRWKTARGMSRIAHVVPGIWQTPDGSTQVVSGAGDVVQGIDARTGRLLWTSVNTGEGVVPSIVLGEQLALTACGWSGRESIKAFRLGVLGDLGRRIWRGSNRRRCRASRRICIWPPISTRSAKGASCSVWRGTAARSCTRCDGRRVFRVAGGRPGPDLFPLG